MTREPAPMITQACQDCGKEYQVKGKFAEHSKYCSDACRRKAFMKAHKAYTYTRALSSEAQAWRRQHQAEVRKSNPEYFNGRDREFRKQNYGITYINSPQGKYVKLPPDPLFEEEVRAPERPNLDPAYTPVIINKVLKRTKNIEHPYAWMNLHAVVPEEEVDLYLTEHPWARRHRRQNTKKQIKALNMVKRLQAQLEEEATPNITVSYRGERLKA